MTEKRFDVVMNEFDEVEYITDIVDCEDRDFADFIEFANEMAEENEQLKQSVNNLKDTIIKITIAYQRKYDRTIVDLVDEVHDEDITDLIKELQRND